MAEIVNFDGVPVSGWSRTTVADGRWLNKNTIEPLSARTDILKDAINNLDASDIGTYTSAEIDEKIANLGGFVVTPGDYSDGPDLSAVSANSKMIYLVKYPSATGKKRDYYSEWIVTSGEDLDWTCIGETVLSLGGYVNAISSAGSGPFVTGLSINAETSGATLDYTFGGISASAISGILSGISGISISADNDYNYIGHSNSIQSGTVGLSADIPAADNSTVTIPYIEYDEHGHIVSAENHTIKKTNVFFHIGNNTFEMPSMTLEENSNKKYYMAVAATNDGDDIDIDNIMGYMVPTGDNTGDVLKWNSVSACPEWQPDPAAVYTWDVYTNPLDYNDTAFGIELRTWAMNTLAEDKLPVIAMYNSIGDSNSGYFAFCTFDYIAHECIYKFSNNGGATYPQYSISIDADGHITTGGYNGSSRIKLAYSAVSGSWGQPQSPGQFTSASDAISALLANDMEPVIVITDAVISAGQGFTYKGNVSYTFSNVITGTDVRYHFGTTVNNSTAQSFGINSSGGIFQI